ncbi:MAG: CBS domain-containing protein [Pelagibacteraceae bacterium]|jgi:CBS domain-containing protein|nr:CBS domain-containing protein [Pelagibacteraceae bacterium]MBT3902655.1 CBS domain-containing protein [Pelagibacteraceae bacterium]MBT4951882.1 CBS domain-containing protein [Pelagibacteraceae bacterium]MBT5213229.1 CBS domain-containing protein [Pelagibacteraceae bacterium]MBT6355381.1 CBS domain-containing protein [Pelagibacteraceae bacterium]
MAEKLVTKLSKRKCFTLNENDTLKIVSEKLQKHNIGSMPVLSTQNNNVIGIVSERDLARYISNDEFKNDLPVTEIMSKNLITCNLNTSVTELMEIITNKKIRHILIMDEILEHTAEQDRVTVEIENAKQLVGKDSDKYIQNLEKKMQDHASKQEFEEATQLRNEINRKKAKQLGIEEKKLLGVVSIGDVINHIIEQYKEENQYLKNTINTVLPP